MTPSWIENLEDIYADGGNWEDFLPILESINKLLERAMLETDDEILQEDIKKEISDE